MDASTSSNLAPKTIQLQLAFKHYNDPSLADATFSVALAISGRKKVLQQTGNILISVSALLFFF